MNLTNEEKKRIADSATYLMQAFCEYKMAEDRLNIMSSLAGTLLKMGFNNEMSSAALNPYMNRLKIAQKNFFDALEIGEDNKDFWQYNSQVESKRLAKTNMEVKNEVNNQPPPIDPSDSCIEG